MLLITIYSCLYSVRVKCYYYTVNYICYNKNVSVWELATEHLFFS